jgi:hypothetical protein
MTYEVQQVSVSFFVVWRVLSEVILQSPCVGTLNLSERVLGTVP